MTILLLFAEFFKVGLFTFGGGYAMIPLVKEVALSHGWMTELEFFDFIGICESTPGPIAINMATYIGSTQAGFWGSLVATLGVVLPSFIIILLVATLVKHLIKNPHFQAVLNGIKPIVSGMIVATGLLLVLKLLGYSSATVFNFDVVSLIIFSTLAVSYCVIRYGFKRKINSILYILSSAVVGVVFSIIMI